MLLKSLKMHSLFCLSFVKCACAEYSNLGVSQMGGAPNFIFLFFQQNLSNRRLFNDRKT